MRAQYLILVTFLALTSVGCEDNARATDAEKAALARGAELIHTKGCGSCHIVPGVSSADGVVGPPLNAWGQHVYIAGRLPNNSANLIRWLIDTHDVIPNSAMPEVPLTYQEANDIATYLHSLREKGL